MAYDGTGEVSPFTESLVGPVLTPNIEVRQLLTDIRYDVIARTAGRHVPWDVSSLMKRAGFAGGCWFKLCGHGWFVQHGVILLLGFGWRNVADGRAHSMRDYVRSGYLLGRVYQLGGPLRRDPAKAIPLFEAGAQRDDLYAQHALGKALVEGVGTKPDIPRGIEFLTKAAEAGHTYAMNAFGTEHLNGDRVAKDPARALRFFQESADGTDISDC